MIKSPSDTTIYAPGLQKIGAKDREEFPFGNSPKGSPLKQMTKEVSIDNISKFIEGIRM